MNNYRPVDWKRNIRSIPDPTKAKLSSDPEVEFVAGCVLSIPKSDIENGKFDHLKLQMAGDRLVFVDQVLPPANMGKYSTRNREGWEEVRKDLPKYWKTFSFEAPNYGNWAYGSHTVSHDREVYHRDYFDPLDLFVEVRELETTSADRFVIKFVIGIKLDRNLSYFEDDLLFALNLLQENTGNADIIPVGASDRYLLSTLELNWEIFPPKSEEDIIRVIRESRRSISTDELSTVKERLAIFSSLNPKQLIRGKGGLNQYIGAQFADDLIVFENVRKGNALYILFEDWEKVSRLSRREILRSSDVNYHRIEHKEGWVAEFKKFMRNELQNRDLASDLFKPAA
ncbi:MAG: hypothetical protein GY751_12345 [Bacteroidetes bacterium]|nr:hypothetical protein [Bacteroidota bacterium]